jgi:hypothetical protein
MPELQSCYFCGTADDVTEYAVVPPRFADSEDEERSAVLCEQCKDKLMRVIEPLAEKLDAGAAAGETPPAASSAGPSTPATAADDGGIVMNPGTSPEPDDESPAETPEEAPESKPNLDAESPAGEAAKAHAEGSDDSRPANYRKAMRLLSNREFPMERPDVEELLAGAYEMENEEVAAILAYAKESGRLEEDAGTFTRA